MSDAAMTVFDMTGSWPVTRPAPAPPARPDGPGAAGDTPPTPDAAPDPEQRQKAAQPADELSWHYGPTATDEDPGKRWHYYCGGEVYGFKEGDICSKCGAEDDGPGGATRYGDDDEGDDRG